MEQMEMEYKAVMDFASAMYTLQVAKALLPPEADVKKQYLEAVQLGNERLDALQRLEGQFTELQSENRKLLEQNSVIPSLRQDLAAARSDIHSLNDELAQVTADKNAINQKTLKESNDLTDELRRSLATSQISISKLESQVSEILLRNDALSQENSLISGLRDNIADDLPMSLFSKTTKLLWNQAFSTSNHKMRC
jgi:DNA repair exonuclease SbcCD ATPase subunit